MFAINESMSIKLTDQQENIISSSYCKRCIKRWGRLIILKYFMVLNEFFMFLLGIGSFYNHRGVIEAMQTKSQENYPSIVTAML